MTERALTIDDLGNTTAKQARWRGMYTSLLPVMLAALRNIRTGFAPRSAATATPWNVASTSIPAPTGCSFACVGPRSAEMRASPAGSSQEVQVN